MVRTLAIDWSGDRKAGPEKIWLCEVAGGRVERLENGRSREEIGEHLLEEARRDPAFVVGLDFAFSFPAAFSTKRGHVAVDTVWAEAEELGEDWLAECPSPPFWGKPGKKKPALGRALFRRTDLAVGREFARRPMSVFQIGGAGAVGVGSLRGMPILRSLRRAGFAVWPFDAPDPAGGRPLAVEIWPRLFMGTIVKSRRCERARFLDELDSGAGAGATEDRLSGSFRAAAERSDDAFDALVSALAMDRRREEFARLEPAIGAETLLEGEIWR